MPRGKAEFKTQKPVETEADVSVSPVVDASNRHVPSMREMNPSGSYETLLDVLVDRTEVGIAAKELEEDIITEPNYYRDLEVKELDDDLLVEKGLSFMEGMEDKSIESLAALAIRGEFRKEKIKKIGNGVVGYVKPQDQERPKELRPRAGDLEVKELDDDMIVSKGDVKNSLKNGAKLVWTFGNSMGIVPMAAIVGGSLVAGNELRKRQLQKLNDMKVKSPDDDMLVFKGQSFLEQIENRGMNINRKINTQQRRTQNKVNTIAKPSAPKPPSISRPKPNKPVTPTVTKPAPPAGVKTRGAAKFVVGKGFEVIEKRNVGLVPKVRQLFKGKPSTVTTSKPNMGSWATNQQAAATQGANAAQAEATRQQGVARAKKLISANRRKRGLNTEGGAAQYWEKPPAKPKELSGQRPGANPQTEVQGGKKTVKDEGAVNTGPKPSKEPPPVEGGKNPPPPTQEQMMEEAKTRRRRRGLMAAGGAGLFATGAAGTYYATRPAAGAAQMVNREFSGKIVKKGMISFYGKK